MNNNTNIFILLALFTGFCVTAAEGAVVIKVRAINPLEEEAPVTIHYPLPAGLTPEDVLAKRVGRGKGPAVAGDFEINFDENEKVYFVDHLITLAPKEIVVLEVEAKDIWTVPQKTIDGLKKQAEDLLKARPPSEEFASPVSFVSEEAAAGPDPVALKLKEEISRQLEEIVEAQKATAITQVGVQGHIEAYQKNRETLQQVGMDITMLRNMLSAREAREEEEKPAPAVEKQTQDQVSSPESASAPLARPAEQKQSVADKLKSLFRWK
ncbi:MAG: hypothetical protein HZC18_03940 [Candidatus Omnitrophica bacterium]|nr:hypothetical protein [Candidatus Omnitrophota bacterium]